MYLSNGSLAFFDVSNDRLPSFFFLPIVNAEDNQVNESGIPAEISEVRRVRKIEIFIYG